MVYVLEHNTLKSKQYFITVFRGGKAGERGVCIYVGKRAMLFLSVQGKPVSVMD